MNPTDLARIRAEEGRKLASMTEAERERYLFEDCPEAVERRERQSDIRCYRCALERNMGAVEHEFPETWRELFGDT